MSNEKTSFWSFLNEYKIKVPVIQRDYVQGREGEDEGNIRANFLEAIRKALDGEVLSLDFVYGTNENEVFEPLDGQQRLTTLWLLHWYIACKAGVLDDSVKNKLSRLTYEERQPAEEFCKQLCRFDFNAEGQNGIVKCIEGKCAEWFKDSEYKDKWQNDPTIKAMLYMLGGKKENKKNNNKDIADNIEKLFEGTDKETYLNYWKKLTFENANEVPIVFYYLPLKQFGLSDDLYIKMNARGLLLTDYEYLKADLIKYMKEQKKQSKDKAIEWEKLLDEDSGIPKKMDDEWINIFLPKCPKNKEIDGIYFAFLNRFFWNELFIKEPNNQKEIKSFDEKGSKKYSNFESYEYLLNKDPLGFFQNLQNVLDRYLEYTKSNDVPCAKWFKDFGLIPSGDSDMEDDTDSKRAIFFALCKYFKDGKADKTSLDRWMRIVCNLVSGIAEDNGWQIDENKNKIFDYIDKLDSHNVYESLYEKKLDEENDSPFTFEGKCNEEIIKVKKILEDRTGTWENKIKEAENYAFFYGAIRFLFQNEEGKEDWKCFKDKWKNVKEYFKKVSDPDNEETISCLNNNNADLLKMFISWFDEENYNNILCHYERTGIFNNRTATWRYYLSNREICLPVHHLLLGEKNNKLYSFSDDRKKNVVRLLSKTKLLDYTIKEEPDLCLCDWPYLQCKALYKYGTRDYTGKYVRLDFWLDPFILHNEKISITNDPKIIKGTELHYGCYEVYFKYKRKHWLLWTDNNGDIIYLQPNDNPLDSGASVPRHKKNPKTPEEEFYCLNVKRCADNNWDNKEKAIFDGLDKLIEEYDMKK